MPQSSADAVALSSLLFMANLETWKLRDMATDLKITNTSNYMESILHGKSDRAEETALSINIMQLKSFS